MKYLQPKRSAIGLDIGSHVIKAAQLAREGDKQTIVALSIVPRLKPGGEIERDDLLNLRRVLKRQGFTGSAVVLAVPDDSLLRGNFDLPPGVTGDPLAQMARVELSRIHHVEPTSFEMIHWGLPAGEQSNAQAHTVAVACPHEAAHQLVDNIEISGFDVRALDVRTAASARACCTLTAAPPAITAILDLGWSSSKLSFVCGEAVVYERLLNSQLDSLTRNMSSKFQLDVKAAGQLLDAVGFNGGADVPDLDPAAIDAIRRLLQGHVATLIEELAVPFSYATHQYNQDGLQRLLLLGGGAGIPGLQEHLAEALKMEVHRAAPSDLLASTDTLLGKASNPCTTVALGLALFSEC